MSMKHILLTVIKRKLHITVYFAVMSIVFGILLCWYQFVEENFWLFEVSVIYKAFPWFQRKQRTLASNAAFSFPSYRRALLSKDGYRSTGTSCLGILDIGALRCSPSPLSLVFFELFWLLYGGLNFFDISNALKQKRIS